LPSVWSIKKVKNRYYLYHRGQYVGPVEEIVSYWKKCSVAGPGGFEPPTTGLGGRRQNEAIESEACEAIERLHPSFYKTVGYNYVSQVLINIVREMLGGIRIDGNRIIIEFVSLDALLKFVEFLKSLGVTIIQRREIRIVVDKQFEEYLRKDRGLDERTIRDYLNYLRKIENEALDYNLYLRIAHSKWMVKAVRLYIDYLYKMERITAEEYQKLKFIFKVKQVESVKSAKIDVQQLLGVFRHPRLRPYERLLFEILLYSGVRFSEAVKLINEFDERGLECFDEFCRYPLFWSRGRKRCDWVYLPAFLVDELRRLRGAYVGKNLRTVYRNLKRKFNVDVKDYRKLFYRVCRDVSEKEVCDFYQGRISKLSTGDKYYDDLMRRADKGYKNVLAELLALVKHAGIQVDPNEAGSRKPDAESASGAGERAQEVQNN